MHESIPEITIGREPDGNLITLEEAGFDNEYREKLRNIARTACMQILYGLPREAAALFPPILPLYGIKGDLERGGSDGLASLSREPLKDPANDDPDPLARARVTLHGIGIHCTPAAIDEQPGLVRQTLIHETLHPMFEYALASSTSVAESMVIALQRSCGIPYHFPKKIEEETVLLHDQENGFRTEDFAETKGGMNFQRVLYMYAANSPKCMSNHTLAELCTDVALKASKEQRLTRFDILKKAILAEGRRGEMLLATLPFKPIRSGRHCYTVLNKERTDAKIHVFDVTESPTADPLVPCVYTVEDSHAAPGTLDMKYRFASIGTVTFHASMETTGQGYLVQSKELMHYLLSRRDALRRLGVTDLDDLDDITCTVNGHHTFELLPDRKN